MTTNSMQDSRPLVPTAITERIEALDVIRGFALIGVLLMNIEFFNRYTGDSSMGIAPGLSGANLWFSYFVQYFVTGKFWTIFSMLFGMGFAVMLTRAEAAQRSFLGPYVRRIIALAVFGALHYVLLWNGDILFGYAATAVGLLVVLYGRGKYILLSIVAFAGVAAVPGLSESAVIAISIAYFGVLAWYLRCPDRIVVFKRSVPIFKIVVGFLMTVSLGAILVGLLAPGLPREARMMAPIIGAVVLGFSLLMARFHGQTERRALHMGVALYSVAMLMITCIGAAQYWFPNPDKALMQKTPVPVSAPAVAKPAVAAPAAAKPAPATPQTEAERIAEKRKKSDEMLAERKVEKERELRVLTTGSYLDVISLRGEKFVKDAPGQFGFATQVITMFLIGLWFVRSGIMVNPGAHLPLFRKLVLIGLPLGIGLGLAGSQIATAGMPGTMDESNGFMFATGLLMLGNLPASIGYIALVVLLLNSRSVFSRISILAPYGRMALTNYLTHSLVFSFVFYGYGLGYFGIERIWQLACVCAMVLVQIPLSHLWLSRFRYGPMEWLWRAITYWHIPAMRITPARAVAVQPA